MARQVKYHPVFYLALRHGYFASGEAEGAQINEAPGTGTALEDYRLRLHQQGATASLWQSDALATEPVPAKASFGFFLEAASQKLLATAEPDWAGAGNTTTEILYLSNKDKAQDPTQALPSQGFETLPLARHRVLLPQSFTPGEVVRLSRWWTGETLFETEIGPDRRLALPLLPAARYALRSRDQTYHFCALPQAPRPGCIALLELGLSPARTGTEPPAPTKATLSFTARSVRIDYAIKRPGLTTPLEKSRIQDKSGAIQFARLAQAAGQDPNIVTFRAQQDFALSERPKSSFDLLIPPHDLKTPAPLPLPFPDPRTIRIVDGAPRAVVHVAL